MFSSAIQQFIKSSLIQSLSSEDSDQTDFSTLLFLKVLQLNHFALLLEPSLEGAAPGTGDNNQPWKSQRQLK